MLFINQESEYQVSNILYCKLKFKYNYIIRFEANREKVLEYSIRSICDGTIITQMHPRTAINIILQEIQNDGNVIEWNFIILKLDYFANKLIILIKYLACALNCVCLALLDANIPLKYTFAAVNCSLLENENKIVYFPSSKQEKVIFKFIIKHVLNRLNSNFSFLKESFATCTFLFDSINKDIITVNLNGSLSQDQFNYLLNNAKQYAIDKIFPIYTDLINKKYSKEC